MGPAKVGTGARVVTLSPEHVWSTHGEMKISVVGSADPRSRRATAVAMVSPPPAESPASETFS